MSHVEYLLNPSSLKDFQTIEATVFTMVVYLAWLALRYLQHQLMHPQFSVAEIPDSSLRWPKQTKCSNH